MRGALGCILALAALLFGCDKAPPPAPAGPRKLLVLGTTYPLAQIAGEVGADAVQTEWLIEQGQSFDASGPNPEISQRLRRADLVISNGLGDEWASEGVDDPLHSTSIIRMDLLKTGASVDGAKQFCLDPSAARELAAVLAERLSLKRPAQSAMFHQNADRFGQSVDALNKEFSPKSLRLWGKQVLVLSQDYSAFTKALGMVEIRPLSASPLRLSDDELAVLRNTVKTEPISAMLVECSTPLGVQNDLARRLGVPVIALDSLGTSSGVGRNSYLSILRYNLEQLARLLA